MIALIQRVTSASVLVKGELVGEIDQGILLLLGVQKADNEAITQRLVNRVINYRIFEDDTGRMNRSLLATEGDLLIVPQFTLPADTRKGTRPSFTPAAPPELGERLFRLFVNESRLLLENIHTGVFGADMQVALVNDGPATFWLEVD